jgi:hypothetical protein
MGYTPAQLELRQIAGGWTVHAPGDTTDDLKLYANRADTAALLMLYGGGAVVLTVAPNYNIDFNDTTVNFLRHRYTSPDVFIESPIADKNIYLKTAGTGLVKFGTRTAGGDTVSNGYMTILDAAGNTVKLMTTA